MAGGRPPEEDSLALLNASAFLLNERLDVNFSNLGGEVRDLVNQTPQPFVSTLISALPEESDDRILLENKVNNLQGTDKTRARNNWYQRRADFVKKHLESLRSMNEDLVGSIADNVQRHLRNVAGDQNPTIEGVQLLLANDEAIQELMSMSHTNTVMTRVDFKAVIKVLIHRIVRTAADRGDGGNNAAAGGENGGRGGIADGEDGGEEADDVGDEVDPVVYALNNHPILRCSYKALRVIGRGTFGTVALCKCNTSGRPVAVKSFKKADSMEAFALQTLKGHPNITKLLFDIKVGNQQHIVLEYSSGGDLCTLLKKIGPLSEKFSANLAGQLVAGLKHIHDEGFAHLDLKPSNLLLHSPLPRLFVQTYNPKESRFDDEITHDFVELKIGDFGLATRENRMRGGFGNFHYMAPEILAFKENPESEEYDPFKADFFSVGRNIFAFNFGLWYQDNTPVPVPSSPILPDLDAARAKCSQELWSVFETALVDDPNNRDVPAVYEAIDNWTTAHGFGRV